MEIWTQLPQEALGPIYGPRASCVNCVHISHMALEAMLQLLLVASAIIGNVSPESDSSDVLLEIIALNFDVELGCINRGLKV